ncbi:MAG: Flp pilus assembly protein CpaB [Parvularculaceae bacterium]|nr:Flp pilus assembly protein CpaB [Parvularculaceae bacterium]
MRNTSIIVLAAAVILGLLAVAGVQGVLSARSGETAKVAMTTVVVARKPLEFGNELATDALEEKQWPADAVPEGSFTKIEEVVGSERRVALRSIAVGEPVLKERVSGFGGRAALSQVIEEGHRAVAVRVSDVSGAGGFILPGDRVDVLSTISPTNERLDTITNILLENVRVLAIDQEADESTGGAIVAKAATIEVKPEDAQKIALASTIGTLSLSLRNTLAIADAATEKQAANRPIRYKDLGPAIDEAKPPVVRAAPVNPNATMNVIRGVEPTRASVPREGARAQATIGASASDLHANAGAAAAQMASTLKIGAPAGE